jgi:hypothetical protein
LAVIDGDEQHVGFAVCGDHLAAELGAGGDECEGELRGCGRRGFRNRQEFNPAS